MIRTVFFDAGDVIFLNDDGYAIVNQSVLNFIEANESAYTFGVLSPTSVPVKGMLDDYEISQHFKLIQTAKDTDVPVSDPQFFTSAAASQGAAPGECVIVAANEQFLDSAQKAGLHIVPYQPGMNLTDALAILTKVS